MLRRPREHPRYPPYCIQETDLPESPTPVPSGFSPLASRPQLLHIQRTLQSSPLQPLRAWHGVGPRTRDLPLPPSLFINIRLVELTHALSTVPFNSPHPRNSLRGAGIPSLFTDEGREVSERARGLPRAAELKHSRAAILTAGLHLLQDARRHLT